MKMVKRVVNQSGIVMMMYTMMIGVEDWVA